MSENIGEHRQLPIQEEKILKYIKEKAKMVRKEVESLLGVGEARARGILQNMLEER